MATGTVADERRECKRELERTKEELAAAMAEYAAAELAAAGGEPESHPALVDRRVRRTALLAARRGLEAAYVRDRSDGGRCGRARSAAGDAPRGPRGVAGGDGRGAGAGVDGPVRLRRLRDERAPARAGHGHRGLDDADGAAHGEPGGVVVLLRGGGPALVELAEVNYGAKRIERTTRSVGDDAESRREAALSGALSVVSPEAAATGRRASR